MLKKKILITGAEGFVSRNLSYFLRKKKFLVYGIGTKKFSKTISNKFGYQVLINKKINIINLKKKFKKFDLIIHCAGSASVGMDPQIDYKKNYTGGWHHSFKSRFWFIARCFKGALFRH